MSWLEEKKKAYVASEEIRKAKYKARNEEIDQNHKRRMAELEQKYAIYSAGVIEYNRFNEQITHGVEVRKDSLYITTKKDDSEVIAYSDIISVEPYTETELKTKNKSVLGRAVVGGALLGGAGAVVGGMTGLDKKEVKKDKRYIILTYRKNGEIVERTFEIMNMFWKKLVLSIENQMEDAKSEISD